MAVTLSAPAVDAAMAKQWGGGDRCPFASVSSSLATIPADHPPIPLPTFEDHPVHVHTDDEVDDDTVHAHHHLPAADTIPSDPILYLPPLLSPLPAHLAHKHQDDPTEEELSSFDTHLPDIDPASLALHQALHHFAPVDNHYAARPYHTAFNWKAVGEHMDVDIEREWYCVVFRSRRNKGSESLDLYKADRGAHEEAVKNGGLILYWYGVPDSTGLNLATCIWQSRRHAVKAISGPKHLLAMKHAENAYEVYDLERWILRKEKGVKGLTLQKWQSGDVGW